MLFFKRVNMLFLTVSESMIEHCKKLVERFNFGNRYTGNGSKEQQLTGIIGQGAVMSLFDCGLVEANENGFDGGVDFVYEGVRIDVKTVGRNTDINTKYDYANNFSKFQDSYDNDAYIFCSLNKKKNRLVLCGWIDKPTFVLRRILYPKGSFRSRFDGSQFEVLYDNFEIMNSQLFSFVDLPDLKNQIKTYALKLKAEKGLNFNQIDGQFYLPF